MKKKKVILEIYIQHCQQIQRRAVVMQVTIRIKVYICIYIMNFF